MTRAACSTVWLAIAAAGCSSPEPVDVCGVEQHGGNPAYAVPPAESAKAPAGDGPGYVYAVDQLFLGDADRNGRRSANAWQTYSYNIDGRASAADSADHCQLYAGAAASSKEDACGGIDNSFAKNFLPLSLKLATGPLMTDAANDAIAQGRYTIIFTIDQLGAGHDYRGLTGAYVVGAASGKVKLTGGYVTNGTWVSGDPVSIDAWLPGAKYNLALRIRHAVATMKLAPDRSSGEGVIAGVIEVEPFATDVRKMLGNFSKDLCQGTTVESVVTTIRQFADINADGSQNPTKTCDGMSFGWGFHAKRVEPGTVGAAPSATPDPCK